MAPRDRSTQNHRASAPDVAIIGDGVIGLSTALELARRGATCCIIGAQRPGAASAAAAGLLVPGVGLLPPSARPLFTQSLDSYPEFLASLREFDPGLSMLRGLIEIVEDSSPQSEDASARQLRTEDVAALEPSLRAPLGALLHPRDGAIDNVRLVSALRLGVASHASVRSIVDSTVEAITATDDLASVTLHDGSTVAARYVVIAAGAWSPGIRGLPRPLPVSPLKGQMLALAATTLRHAVMGHDVYLVPREHEIVVGATSEHAGFDTSTTSQAIDALRAAAATLCPELASAPLARAWAGIRPATPDMLPIIGPDPDAPRFLYACGHSKNGILLAPATARAIAALAQETQPECDLTAFSISRF